MTFLQNVNDTFLQNVHISCHHGIINKENQLEPVKQLLSKPNDIDMIEIDFVCVNNNYISSHDYDQDQIKLGSTLDEWVDLIMLYDKILWIDLKDNFSSLFLWTSQLNIQLLINKLNKLRLKYHHLNDHILLGCQYMNGYHQLRDYHGDYTLITDLPHTTLYVIDYITPWFLKPTLNDIINKFIDINDNIIAIDKSFYNHLDDLISLINKSSCQYVILYNFEQGDIIPICHKNLIIQYNIY